MKNCRKRQKCNFRSFSWPLNISSLCVQGSLTGSFREVGERLPQCFLGQSRSRVRVGLGSLTGPGPGNVTCRRLPGSERSLLSHVKSCNLRQTLGCKLHHREHAMLLMRILKCVKPRNGPKPLRTTCPPSFPPPLAPFRPSHTLISRTREAFTPNAWRGCFQRDRAEQTPLPSVPVKGASRAHAHLQPNELFSRFSKDEGHHPIRAEVHAALPGTRGRGLLFS